MLGRDADDPAQAEVAPAPVSRSLEEGVAGLRIARLGGYFARFGEPSAFAAVDAIAGR